MRLEAIETNDNLLQMHDVKLARMNGAGTHFAVHSGDSVSIQAAADGERLARWTVAGTVDVMRLSPKGERLLLSDGERLRLLRVDGEAALLESGALGRLVDARFAAESDAFITLHAAGVALWDGQDGAPKAVYALGLPADSAAAQAMNMAVSADGERLTFLARLEDGIVSLSQFTAGDAAVRASTFVDIAAADLSADGATLTLLRGNGEIRVMYTATGSALARVQTELARASQLQFMPQQKRLYIAADTSLLVYDADSGSRLSQHQQSRPITRFNLSADGRVALTREIEGRAWLWRIESQAELLRRIEAEARPRALTCAEREAYLALPLCD